MVIYSELAITRELVTINCFLAEIQQQAEEWETIVERKRKGFVCILIGGSWHKEAVGRLTRSRASHAVCLELIFVFF